MPSVGALGGGGLPCLATLGCPDGNALLAGLGPHAVGFVPVFTQARRGVFVVGGTDVTASTPSGEVWFVGFGSNRWVRYGAAFKPHHVLAATFVFANDALLVLDETETGDARLVTIDFMSQAVSEIGRWRRHASWDRHFLAVDRDGALLVIASNTTAGSYGLSRVALRGGAAAVEGLEFGVGTIVASPEVDMHGMSVVVRDASDPTAGPVTHMRRTRSWTAGSFTLADVGSLL